MKLHRPRMLTRRYWRAAWEAGKRGADYRARGESISDAARHAREDVNRQWIDKEEQS